MELRFSLPGTVERWHSTSADLPEEATMKIVIPADGADLDAPTSPVFGRCQTFMFVNSDTFDFEVLPNPARDASGGAGVQAAQLVLQHGAEAVIARRLGPNAFRLIHSSGIPAYVLEGATVRETVRAFQAKRLRKL
jgi:predicted Fe-Mo cluster-binding NifX family protein